MKKPILLLWFVFLMAAACKDRPIKTPDNLIEESQMVDILYDLSVLDAMKSQGFGPDKNYPTPKELLKKKYKVDSLTFAENSKYYAADIKNYKKMYDKVKERLNEESAKINGGNSASVATPVEEQGVVK